MNVLRDSQAEVTRFQARALVLAVVMLLAFGLLAWRLVVLQVLRHDDLAQQAESNRTAVVPIVPNRGEVFDRTGVRLASNYKAYTVELLPAQIADLDQTLELLGQLIEITPRDLRRFKKLLNESKGFDSLPLRTRLTDTEVARLAAQHFRLPGVEVKARLFRSYPLGETASHIIGYIGRINPKEQEEINDSEDAANYRGTDHMGKLGIEASYEALLHGKTGFEELETSAGGRAVRQLARHPATQGESLELSIDINLQRMVEQLFGDRRGALVAIDPRNGEVLALVSKPTFDPNLFVDGIDQDSWDELSESINKPLLNRALKGTYPPGSTYKPFMGLAALEKKLRSPSTIVVDNGSWTFGNHTFRSGHALGPVDLRRAVIHSSNVYFYQLGNDMGVDGIHDFMKRLGFGQITGIDLPGEVRGVLPSTDWKRRTYNRPEQKKWYPGETISLGIGQGYNNFTMLQLATATATLANGGVRYRPHLMRAHQDSSLSQLVPSEREPGENLGYQEANLELIRQAMVAVPQEGTSRAAFVGAPYLSGGKTGTAQAVGVAQNSHYDAAKLAEHQRDHSLYIGFAPADHPTIAVACIVENVGFGAVHAAPIVRRVFDYWVSGLYPSEEDMAAVAKGQATAPLGTPRQASVVAIRPDRPVR